MAGISDTSLEAERVLTQIYRRLTPGQKWLRLGQAYRDARLLHAAGVRLRRPMATEREILADWLHVHVGLPAAVQVGEPIMSLNAVYLEGVREVIAILRRLGISHVLSGSLAGSVHGFDRYTQDADLMVEPFPGREAEFVQAFGPDYYISQQAVEQANRDHFSFNVIHTTTGFKADLFVRKNRPFERSVLARRLALPLPDRPELPIDVCTPEDLALLKLQWYRLGNETSEQQWKDVTGILRVQGDRLDQAYLEHWATELGVTDLLVRVQQEARERT